MNRIPSRVRALLLGMVAAGAITAAATSEQAAPQDASLKNRYDCNTCTISDVPSLAAKAGIRW